MTFTWNTISSQHIVAIGVPSDIMLSQNTYRFFMNANFPTSKIQKLFENPISLYLNLTNENENPENYIL
jgi:hypothetical protein